MSPSRKDTLEGRVILVVEDNLEFRDVIVTSLADAGCRVVGTNSGLRARELLESRQFDLILSDWRVPDLTGIDLACYVMQHSRTPFVLMTGFSEVLERRDAFQSGATAFLNKPFTREELLLTVEECLRDYPRVYKTSQTSSPSRRL